MIPVYDIFLFGYIISIENLYNDFINKHSIAFSHAIKVKNSKKSNS